MNLKWCSTIWFAMGTLAILPIVLGAATYLKEPIGEHILSEHPNLKNYSEKNILTKNKIGKRIAVTAIAGAVVAGVQGVKTLLSSLLSNSGARRKCAIGLANTGSVALVNPTWYIEKGILQNNLPKMITPDTTGLLEFENSPQGFAHGTSGVLTYTIEGTNFVVAVMWSIPWTFATHSSWFNMKVYENKRADDKLWDQMYRYSEAWDAQYGGYRSRDEYGIRLHGSMTYGPEAKLEVYADSIIPKTDGSYHVHKGCRYNVGWLGSYCWKECKPSGWCWVNTSCSSSDKVCTPSLACHSDCD